MRRVVVPSGLTSSIGLLRMKLAQRLGIRLASVTASVPARSATSSVATWAGAGRGRHGWGRARAGAGPGLRSVGGASEEGGGATRTRPPTSAIFRGRAAGPGRAEARSAALQPGGRSPAAGQRAGPRGAHLKEQLLHRVARLAELRHQRRRDRVALAAAEPEVVVQRREAACAGRRGGGGGRCD
jgi:hypothetical protein